MKIKGEILDSRKDGDSSCYLMKISLKEYLLSLPDNYTEYDVQREIVSSNVYLDKMIDTVLSKYHIPSIVLVTDDLITDDKSIELSQNYRIIDGLQRTHRLKMIYETFLLFSSEIKKEDSITTLSKYILSKKYSEELSKINSNYKTLSKIIDFYKSHNIEVLEQVFAQNYLWFEVWTNLSASGRVEKMLVLNAGHKPVKLKHQLELLFINDLLIAFRSTDKFKDFKLIREKERNSTSFSKNREYGEFHFSQLIACIIAFDKGKVVVSNTNLISQIQENDFTIQELNNELSYDFINDFIEFLLDFDRFIANNYNEGVKWLGRETSLVGLFAALGSYRYEKDVTSPKSVFCDFMSFLDKNPKVLNLNKYDESRQILDFSKINFGNVNRKVVFKATKQLLDRMDNPQMFDDEPIDWRMYFKNLGS